MSKFTVKSTIKHNGKTPSIGAVIELEDDDQNADYLVGAGVLEPAADDAEVSPVKKERAKKDPPKTEGNA